MQHCSVNIWFQSPNKLSCLCHESVLMLRETMGCVVCRHVHVHPPRFKHSAAAILFVSGAKVRIKRHSARFGCQGRPMTNFQVQVRCPNKSQDSGAEVAHIIVSDASTCNRLPKVPWRSRIYLSLELPDLMADDVTWLDVECHDHLRSRRLL